MKWAQLYVKVFKLSKSSFSPLGGKAIKQPRQTASSPNPPALVPETPDRRQTCLCWSPWSPLTCVPSLCLPVPRENDRDKAADNQATADSQLAVTVCLNGCWDDDSAHLAFSESPCPPRTVECLTTEGRKQGDEKSTYSHQLCPISAAISHISLRIILYPSVALLVKLWLGF